MKERNVIRRLERQGECPLCKYQPVRTNGGWGDVGQETYEFFCPQCEAILHLKTYFHPKNKVVLRHRIPKTA